ncbi:nuclear factor NF-kappa-B p110 subunit [Drosophila tropicalis]|uniref:nuclear factor NF-kappa-B p110 subunit n=1 Tax=Drosophila tropicalis TaxID=46794 RepID=UPI0035ABC6DE
MNQYFDLDRRQNVSYLNDASSTSGYSSANSPTSTSMSPAHSPESTTLQNEFANLALPPVENSPPFMNLPYHQQPSQLMPNGNIPNASFGNMYMDHQYYTSAPPPATTVQQTALNFQQQQPGSGMKNEFPAVLQIAEQPVEKFRFRYKSEMHGTHGSLNGANSKRTPKTFPEVMLLNYTGPAVIRCSLFQTNLDSPHSHQLVVRKDERDVCDPHDLHVSQERGYVAQFINMGIIHTAKKYIFDELLKKKQDRLVFQMNRRELSTKQIQELHQETEREAKDMNLNQVRLCFEAFKIGENNTWTQIAAPVFSNPINNRKSAQTGELRIVRLSKPTGSVTGNDELILLVEKVSKKNIKVRFFEENEDGEIVWEAFAKFRESDVHHQYAIVCQTPAYRDKDVDQEVNVSIELIRPSDDERSFPPLGFRYKPRDAIVSRKRRRTCSTATTNSSGSSGTGSANNSMELPVTLAQVQPMAISHHDQTISQEFGKDSHLEELINSVHFRKMIETDSEELERMCDPVLGVLEQDGYGKSEIVASTAAALEPTSKCLEAIFRAFESARHNPQPSESTRKHVEELFTNHARKNDNHDTLLHEVISQKQDNLKLAFKTLQVLNFFGLHDLASTSINADGDSGLHIACQQDRPHYIRPLLKLGCNPNQQNHANDTALHVAVKEERISCIDSFLNGVPPVKLDLTLKNDDGLSPLHMAIRQNKYDIAKKLINHDRTAISVANTTDGNNALHMAVLEQSVELLVLILDAQNSTLTDILQARNAAGYTPLELARCKANGRVVQLLEKVYPDRGETTMTWIPFKVKEEIDSSSDDSSDTGGLEMKTEEDVVIKTEDDDDIDTTPQMETANARNLKILLNNKTRFDKLAAQLNQQNIWRQLAKKTEMEKFVFLWSSAEGMLDYLYHKSSRAEFESFAQALHDQLGVLT